MAYGGGPDGFARGVRGTGVADVGVSVPVVDDISYETRGEGPGLVLLSLPGYDQRVWAKTADLLAGQFTCVLVDQRGCGASPRREEPADQVADVRAVLADAHLPGCAVVAVGSGAGVALGLALDRPQSITAVVVINPSLREYVDPREPTYLGAVIDDSRARSLRAVGWRALVPPRAKRLARLVAPGRSAGHRAETSTRKELEMIMKSSLSHARHPQQHLPLHVVGRLHELDATPVLIMTVGEDVVATGASAAVAAALARELPSAEQRHVQSAWGSVLPFGEPEETAALIAGFAAGDTGRT